MRKEEKKTTDNKKITVNLIIFRFHVLFSSNKAVYTSQSRVRVGRSSKKLSVTDRPTDRQTDGQSGLQSRVHATKKKTSDAGSQCHCGRVSRGIQPPSTPQPTPNTQTYTKSIENASFPTFQLDDHGRTDQRTDKRMDRRTVKASYRVACLKLKTSYQGSQYYCGK